MTNRDELMPICEWCIATVTASRSTTLDGGSVLTVVVEHATDSEDRPCPWSVEHVPAGGALVVRPRGVILHVREGEPFDLPETVGGAA